MCSHRFSDFMAEAGDWFMVGLHVLGFLLHSSRSFPTKASCLWKAWGDKIQRLCKSSPEYKSKSWFCEWKWISTDVERLFKTKQQICGKVSITVWVGPVSYHFWYHGEYWCQFLKENPILKQHCTYLQVLTVNKLSSHKYLRIFTAVWLIMKIKGEYSLGRSIWHRLVTLPRWDHGVSWPHSLMRQLRKSTWSLSQEVTGPQKTDSHSPTH